MSIPINWFRLISNELTLFDKDQSSLVLVLESSTVEVGEQQGHSRVLLPIFKIEGEGSAVPILLEKIGLLTAAADKLWKAYSLYGVVRQDTTLKHNRHLLIIGLGASSSPLSPTFNFMEVLSNPDVSRQFPREIG